jgi:hypothetical protein
MIWIDETVDHPVFAGEARLVPECEIVVDDTGQIVTRDCCAFFPRSGVATLYCRDSSDRLMLLYKGGRRFGIRKTFVRAKIVRL